MILIKLFFIMLAIFAALVVGLGAAIWLRIRHHLQNPFLRAEQHIPPEQDSNIIEGQYQVLDESREP